MPVSPAESAIYRQLFGDDEAAALFSDDAEIRAMLKVEGALAKAQGELGLIPKAAAAFLCRASSEIRIGPSALAASTAINGVPIPALLAAFRAAAQAPDQTDWLHWGATSQDIMDSALALRLKRLFEIWEGRLTKLVRALGRLADDHADVPMAGRTYGQAATPTSFGAVVASWGGPLLRHRDRLELLKPDLLKVSLSGAAGTLSAMGSRGPDVRARLAAELGLTDPLSSWHSERDGIAALAGWMAGLTASLAKMGEDLILMAQTGIGEIAISGAGGSSTMPQKHNPVTASALVALGRQVGGLAATLIAAGAHRQQRDGAAWYTEWLTLPPACVSTSRALTLAVDLAEQVAPVPDVMAEGLAQDHGVIFAESISFALSHRMPRHDAQASVAALCEEARRAGIDLRVLAGRKWPEIDWTVLARGIAGSAPADARAFAMAARA